MTSSKGKCNPLKFIQRNIISLRSSSDGGLSKPFIDLRRTVLHPSNFHLLLVGASHNRLVEGIHICKPKDLFHLREFKWILSIGLSYLINNDKFTRSIEWFYYQWIQFLGVGKNCRLLMQSHLFSPDLSMKTSNFSKTVHF